MNTYKQSHIFRKAKARRQCFFLIMCFHLVLGDVPGPCRHSATKEHLLNIKRLIDNQLQNDCSITYTFIERHSLSKVCYVKAAFPEILELLKTQFQYVLSSDNYRYVFNLKTMVFNIYSQKCIPEINEEIEDDPVRFVKEYSSSRKEALGKIKEVIQLYKELMTENNKPVDWNCEEEYAEDYPESTTALAHPTGAIECHCSCPTLGYGVSEQVSLPGLSQWDAPLQPSRLQSHSSRPSEFARSPPGTMDSRVYAPVRDDNDSHHKIERANSYSSTVRKEEKEEVNADIPSSPFPAYTRDGYSGATPGPTASLIKKGGGPKDSSPSWHRAHLDSFGPDAPRISGPSDGSWPSTLSGKRREGMDVFLGRKVSGKRSPATVAPAFLQSPTQYEISGVTNGQSSQHTPFFDLSHVTVSSSREHADNPTTPAISRETSVQRSPTKPEDTTAIILAKRSIGPSSEGSQSSLGADNQPIQNWIPANSPSASGVSQAGQKTSTTISTVPLPRRTVEGTSRAVSGNSVRQFGPRAPAPVLKHELVPIRSTDEKLKSTGPGSGTSADFSDFKSLNRESGNAFQNLAQTGSHISYKIAFIAASICGGLLLLITLYCFRTQKKLNALLHNSKVRENQRLTSCSKDIEMQHCEITEQFCLDSS